MNKEKLQVYSIQQLTSSVWAVGDNREEMLQDVSEVGLVEALGSHLFTSNVLQQCVEDVQASVSHISHGVFECPDDGVQHQLELCRRDVQQGCKHTIKSESTGEVNKDGEIWTNQYNH